MKIVGGCVKVRRKKTYRSRVSVAMAFWAPFRSSCLESFGENTERNSLLDLFIFHFRPVKSMQFDDPLCNLTGSSN